MWSLQRLERDGRIMATDDQRLGIQSRQFGIKVNGRTPHARLHSRDLEHIIELQPVLLGQHWLLHGDSLTFLTVVVQQAKVAK